MANEDSSALHVMEVETFGRGGLTHYAYNLSCALAERGHRVTFVTTVGYELETRPIPDGVRLEKSIARWTQTRGRTIPGVRSAAVRKLEALFDAAATAFRARQLRPDIVHLHCTNSIGVVYLLLFRLLLTGTGSRVVATAHVVTPHEAVRGQSLVYRLVHRLPHFVVAHSRFDRQRLLDEFGVDEVRTAVIPHGEYGFFERDAEARPTAAAAREWLGLDEHDEVALFFGYLREYKGLDVLLEAWDRVRRERPAARLVVAGDPVQLPEARRQELEDEARGLGAICRFQYVPFADVTRFFAAADALVMPYRRISQSGVLFLALSLGLPVVATRVGGLPEILVEGESAALVPPENPSALAAALAWVLGDGALRKRLAKGGRRVAAEHSWSSIAERTESVFLAI